MASRLRSGLLALLVGAAVVLSAPAVSAQDASNCPAGQPLGRPPGQPPTAGPGPPTGRPPQYPPGECNLRLSRASVARGETVQVSGSGFQPGEDVVLRLGGRVAGGALAGSDGTFAAVLSVPEDAPLGANQVLATGAARQQSAVLEVTGTARAAAGSRVGRGGGGLLPRTGSDLLLTTAAGVGLMAVGAVAVAKARGGAGGGVRRGRRAG